MPIDDKTIARLEQLRSRFKPEHFEHIIGRLTNGDVHADAVADPAVPPSVEYRTAQGANEPPPVGGIVFCRMESNGDLLVFLPAMKQIAAESGRSVTLVTYKKYLPLLSGIPWLNLVGVEGMTRAAAKSRFAHLGEIRDLEPDHTQQSWSLAAFARTGVDPSFYDSLPLEIENRDLVAEAEIIRRHRRDKFRPLILFNTVGKSSPFAFGDVLRGYLAERYADDMEIVDLAFVRPNRITDLLGLYEQACCIITTDTGTLHLAYATKTPTISIARDKEGPDSWGASEPRSHWITRVPYSVAGQRAGLEQITTAIDSLFHQRAI